MSGHRTWQGRGLNSITTRAEVHERRADLRARILRVLAHVGAAGILAGELCDELATRATRDQVRAEASRMRADGLVRHDGTGSSHRWYITDAGREAAGKAAA